MPRVSGIFAAAMILLGIKFKILRTPHFVFILLLYEIYRCKMQTGTHVDIGIYVDSIYIANHK